jgi:hypothetical protein
MVQGWPAGDDMRMVSHVWLVQGSIWVRLLSGPHACYCTSVAALLCGYLFLVVVVDAWNCC